MDLFLEQRASQLKKGLSRTETFTVEEQHTAYHIGSGDERVLGTPWMISFMERVSNRLLAEHIPEGYLTVGTHVDVRHLAPSPIDAKIRIQVEVLEVFKNRVKLAVAAWDHKDKIGDGNHTRAVVRKARFMERADKKSKS
ncbi:MAG: thioesterase family protein [Verrucomicrobiota bacterium]